MRQARNVGAFETVERALAVTRALKIASVEALITVAVPRKVCTTRASSKAMAATARQQWHNESPSEADHCKRWAPNIRSR